MAVPVSLALQSTLPMPMNFPPSLPMSLVSGAASGAMQTTTLPHNSLASTVCTTKILKLSGFNPEMKTRDIQSIFSEWEDEKGGFKIKWVDDTTCLIVFNDPLVAKKCFLNLYASPPAVLSLDSGAKLRAYTGPDVTHILTSVQNRPRSRSNAGQTNQNMALHHRKGSISGRRPSQDHQGGIGGRQQFRSGGASGNGMGMLLNGGKGSPPPPVPEVPTEGMDTPPEKQTRNQVGDAGKRIINHSLSGSINGKSNHAVDQVASKLKGVNLN